MSTQNLLADPEATPSSQADHAFATNWLQQHFSKQNTSIAQASWAGICLGVCFVLVLLPFLSRYGTTMLVQTAVLASLVITSICGLLIRNISNSKWVRSPWMPAGLYLALATWLICLPMVDALANSIWSMMLLQPTHLEQAVARQFNWLDMLCLCLHSCCLIGPPLILWINYSQFTLQSPEYQHGKARVDFIRESDVWSSIGVVTGFVAASFVLGPWVGLSVLFWMLIANCLIQILYVGFHQFSKTEPEQDDQVELQQSCSASESLAGHSAREARFQSVVQILSVLFIVPCGILAYVLLQVSQQLMPVTVYSLLGQIAAMLAGLLSGLYYATQNGDNQRNAVWSSVLITAQTVLVLGLFPQLVHVMLFVTSNVQSVPLLILIRTITLFVLLFPIGFLTGCALGQSDRNRVSEWASLASTSAKRICLLTGWLLAAFWLVPVFQLPICCAAGGIAVLSILFSILTLEGFRPYQLYQHEKLIRRGALGCSMILITASPWLTGNYDPALAARLLFGTNVFDAYRRGVAFDSLAVMDEGRLVETRMGTQGPLSIWKYRGSQMQVRENGFPKGMVSLDDRICPQYSAEVVATLLPILMHERADDILVLGVGSGLNVRTCLKYPIQKLTCVESNSTLINLLSERLWQQNEKPIAQVGWQVADPALAIQKDSGHYDLVFSFPDPPALAQSLPSFSQEFYAGVSRTLKEDGIFCQRFSYVDFGPQPLRDVAATLQAVFVNVMMIETAPGELALLATNSATGQLHKPTRANSATSNLANPLVVDDFHEAFLRDGFLKRLQSPQTRGILAKLGWDWSMILNCIAFDDHVLADFTSEHDASGQTVAGSRWAFSWPVEMMRWGSKWQEIQEQLARNAAGQNRSSRLLAWLPDVANDQNVLQRLADTVGRSNLIAQYPDQPKAYRQTLRKHLSNQPRSRIKHVNGEVKRVLHDDEIRRKDYFKELAAAVKQPHPELEQIQNLELYAEPFDPILSYFLHYEIADLYHKLDPPDYRAEYLHRMHAINYGDRHDRSVRNVALATALLIKHPEIIQDEADRYDHLNTLLQNLKVRWELRKDDQPKHAGTAFNDVQKSLSAAEAAIDAMQQSYASKAVRHPEWPDRRAYLEKVLIRPLRAYRGKLKSHAAKNNESTKALLDYLKQQRKQ